MSDNQFTVIKSILMANAFIQGMILGKLLLG